LRATLQSFATVVLASITIAGVAQHNSSFSNISAANTRHESEFPGESRRTIRADALSPNAGVLIFERALEITGIRTECDIYSVNADGTNEKALTHDGHSHSPSWSPDGKYILFIHYAALRTPWPSEENGDKTQHPTELYVMNRDGGNPHLIQRFEPDIFQAAWSPDGTAIVVETTDRPPGSRPGPYLYLVSPEGRGDPLLLFPYIAGQPAWSPDGKKIFYSRRSDQTCAPLPDPIPPALRALVAQMPCWPWTDWVANADGSNAIQLLVKNDISYTGEGNPTWSPNGKQVAFSSVVDSEWSTQIFVRNEDGSGMQQLTNDPAWINCEHPSWRADSLQIAFSCKHRTHCAEPDEIYRSIIPSCVRKPFVISANNPQKTLTPINENNGSMPAFSPN
jgi:Tol biopolymer transport system component